MLRLFPLFCGLFVSLELILDHVSHFYYTAHVSILFNGIGGLEWLILTLKAMLLFN